ncbi:MAG: DUF3048 domain-containing protein [Anaerolineae bacterium]|nr:DUF3048 domain-containing protein [Anaerolineae bacterium]
MKVHHSLPVVLFAALLIMACLPGGGSAAQADPTPTPLAVPTTPVAPTTAPQENLGPYTFPPGINPLTGLPLDDPARARLRPVAVKISNAPPLVRPQAGIGQADVVFEHYAEGGLTRFTALFLSELPRRVGSVRSARLIDVEIPEMFESYLVYAGSSGGVRERIEASAFADRAFYGVETGPPAYFRDPAIEVPHNLFADVIAVHELAESRGVASPAPLFYSALAFGAEIPPGGSPAATIDIQYRASGAYWQYDADTGLYARWSDGAPHFDATTGEQVTAANVVVLYANHVEDVTIVENEFQGHQSYSIQVQLWGSAPAVMFRDGQRYEGRWERPDPARMFTLRDTQGDIFRLRPGVTFFQLVPLGFDSLATTP